MRRVPRVRFGFAAVLAIAMGVAVVWIGKPVEAQPQEEDLRQQMAALRAAALNGNGRAASGSAGTMSETVFGNATDFFVPADYDGDGKNDHAVWTTGIPGTFKVLRSSDGIQVNTVLGTTGDDPTVVGDYDGDGKADPAVYRASTTPGLYAKWIYQPSGGGGTVTVNCSAALDCGAFNDYSVGPGDYNGDGKFDFAVSRAHTGGACATDNTQGSPAPFVPNADFLITINGGSTATVPCVGKSFDVIVPGDYDGDGRIDPALLRGVSGVIHWTIRRSSTLTYLALQHGNSLTDLPTQGDYDGDGITDLAFWRPSAVFGASAFFIRPSTGGPTVQVPFGLNGDYPIANWNVH